MQELAGDERFATNQARVANREALNGLLRQRLLELDGSDLAQRLRAAKVPFGFVNDMPAVFELAESRAQLFEGGRGVRTVSLTGSVEGRRALPPPPRLDQHRSEILAELD